MSIPETEKKRTRRSVEERIAEVDAKIEVVQQVRLQEQRNRQQPQRLQQQNAAHQLWRCGCVGPSRAER